jgi:pyrroline-5-carboxylate reductase
MRVGFIGAGKMAEAILVALIESGLQKPDDICAGELREPRRRQLKRRHGIRVTARNEVVVTNSDVLFLSIKPQDMDSALPFLARNVTRRHLVLSIAAGKTIDYLEGMLPKARVVRVMPNLAASVGESMSAYCPGSRVRVADCKRVIQLLSTFGKAVELEESLFDAVTALSGSGPAFFAYVLDALVMAGIREGLNRGDALLLAGQTMLGTARVLLDTQVPPAEFIASVASPKGTTAEGLAVLDASDVQEVLGRVIRAAARRSRELSGG